MLSLLERTRMLNRLLQKSGKVDFYDVSRVLSNVMAANSYIIDKDGAIFGYALLNEFECELMRDKVLLQGRFPERYVEWLLNIQESSPNLTLKRGLCAFSEGTPCIFTDKFTTIVPIYGVGERIGTLIVAKFHSPFQDEDLILAEYGATVVGMELLRDRTDHIEEKARQKAAVQIAVRTLSYSESEATIHIFNELRNNEGLVIASKIADRAGITRSVIVNALRKLESAGVIESKSLGMKGTYIKVLNALLIDELKKLKQ